MLIYLLFFYLFRNTPSTIVDASPILKLASNSTSPFPESIISLATRQVDSATAGTCNCNQRSTLDIVWSCIATLFLCTWSSIHPNMPAPKDEWWRILWRRLKSMYWALIAPELVLTWAVRQWIGAGNILEKYGEIPDQPKWTKKHAHFLQMGGFHLRKPEGDKTSVLEPRKFFELLKEKKISVRSIEERDIEDKSKADALTKIVVIFQTLWFVIHCIGRHAQGLALAQLEVATLAVISCTFILCVIWWEKPFDAQQPIHLDLLSQSGSPPRAVVSDKMNTAQENILIENMKMLRILQNSHMNVPVEISEPPTGRSSFIQPAEELVMENPSNPTQLSHAVATASNEIKVAEVGLNEPSKRQAFFQTISVTVSTIYQPVWDTISCIYHAISDAVIEEEFGVIGVCLYWPIIYPIYHLLEGDDSKQERVSSYNSYSDTSFIMLFLPALSAALFGLVHCISWESEFPSATERISWRISAVGVGSLLAVSGLLFKFGVETSNEVLKFFERLAVIVVFAAYILARYYLLLEALLSLRALPPSAFQTVEWSDFLPHM